MNDNGLIQAIKERQNQEALTLAEMAKRLGVTQATLSRIFSGTRGVGRKFLAGVVKAYPELREEVALFLSDSMP